MKCSSETFSKFQCYIFVHYLLSVSREHDTQSKHMSFWGAQGKIPIGSTRFFE